MNDITVANPDQKWAVEAQQLGLRVSDQIMRNATVNALAQDTAHILFVKWKKVAKPSLMIN